MRRFISRVSRGAFATICFFLIVSVALDAFADVGVARIFGDNLVLQRDKPVPVWGWGDKGDQVTVSFNGQEKSVIVDENGKWLLKLDPMKADKLPKQLTIAGKNNIVLKNIVVGDVLICSGQSNMQMSVNQVLQGKKEVAKASFPMIRLMTVPRVANDFLVDDIKVKWSECSPKSVGGFSAVGYFFARKLLKELDVPIGLISTNWGGTRIEPRVQVGSRAEADERVY